MNFHINCLGKKEEMKKNCQKKKTKPKTYLKKKAYE